jgi:4-oxalocrotonate tautomerase
MPVVRVDWWKGPDESERRRLVEEITAAVARAAKCPEAAVHVIVNDVEKDHWGLGGKLADEL